MRRWWVSLGWIDPDFQTSVLSQSPPTCDIIERELLPMEKEMIVARTPPLPKVPLPTEPPVRTMPMDKARKLIRKTSSEHAGLFRRLAK